MDPHIKSWSLSLLNLRIFNCFHEAETSCKTEDSVFSNTRLLLNKTLDFFVCFCGGIILETFLFKWDHLYRRLDLDKQKRVRGNSDGCDVYTLFCNYSWNLYILEIPASPNQKPTNTRTDQFSERFVACMRVCRKVLIYNLTQIWHIHAQLLLALFFDSQ